MTKKTKARTEKGGNISRLFQLAWVVLGQSFAFLVLDPVARRLGRKNAVSKPDRLRILFETLGGSFIKFGQMLALQPDIIPIEFCDALFDLMDRVKPFPYEQARESIVRELGDEPENIFDEFDPKPIATASIGQVYVGVLHGRKVAIKVQRPNAQIDLGGDIRIMRGCLELVRKWQIRPLFFMLEPLSEFVQWTSEELNYLNEARYMIRVRENSRDRPGERVPEVFVDYTTEKVLIAEFVEGTVVLNYLRNRGGSEKRSDSFDLQVFAKNIIDNFLSDAFIFGIFHADLHPANILMLPGNAVGYVDFGITGVLSPYSRRYLVLLTLAYSRGDVDTMCDTFLKVSSFGQDADVVRFREELHNASVHWYSSGKTITLKTNVTQMMLDMIKLSKQTNIWPEREVMKYIRSSVALDGLITRLDAKFDVGGVLAAACAKYLRAEARRQLFSYDRFFRSFLESSNLMSEAPSRVADLLDSFANRLDDRQTSRVTAGSSGPQAVWAGLLTITSGAMCYIGSSGSEPGLNLHTAQLLTFATSALMFVFYSIPVVVDSR
ncbi:MAG: ubiquinone biosynthesis protein [Verrucomicrobiales bacterium]